MLMIRFITAGAVLVMVVGAAAAQGAGGDTAGKPVSLLQVLSQPAAAATTTKPHAKLATRHTARRWAGKSHEHPTEAAAAAAAAAEPEQPASDTANAPAASAWPTGDVAPFTAAAADASAPTLIPAVDQNMSALVVGGRTVQIATPDEANAIDLAADHQAAAQAAVDTQAAPAPAVALAEPDDPQRDTWFEELLATLGGALAAGVVAWFLIMGGGPPQRMYG